MLDYYTLRSDTKTTLLRRWQQLEIAADSLIWAWLGHAFSLEGAENSPLLIQLVDQSKSWLDSSAPWSSDADLGGVGLLCSVLRTTDDERFTLTATRLIERIGNLRARGVGKFSRLNDPDVVFGLVLGVESQLSGELRSWLRQHCVRNAQPGNWRRGLLFAASAIELGGSVSPFTLVGAQLGIHEIFAALWFAARYPQLVDSDQHRRGLWDAFELVREGISLDVAATGNGTLYPASLIDVAMFYEALLKQTQDIDPLILFNNMPWHPQVRHSAQSLFSKGEYVMAVFQAAVTFIDSVKKRANHPTGHDGRALDGATLMSHVFGSKTPRLKFNDLKTLADKDEQHGLALLAEGIVAAVRNPKGHTPQAAIPLSAHEALEQLAVISYLSRRLDSAQA